MPLGPAVFDRHILVLDEAGLAEAAAERNQVWRKRTGRNTAEESDHRHRRLLRARHKRPCSHRRAKRGSEFSPSDMDCHVTLPWGSYPCNGRGRYHALIVPSAATSRSEGSLKLAETRKPVNAS